MQPVVEASLNTINAVRLGCGRYTRWLGREREKQGCEGLTLNPYGCADAANILYTLGHFPSEQKERDAWVQTLQKMQDTESGLFHENTHHTYHVTAHCAAALELFDARPLHPLRALEYLDSPGALEQFLTGLAWVTGPWNASHQGAGVFAARVICGEASADWEERYFVWLWRETDPVSGFWRSGAVNAPDSAPLFHHLAGSFHYLFNHEHARRPLRFAESMIDTCLRIRSEKQWKPLGAAIGFAEIDWVYCLTRATRQCGHRFAEVSTVLREFAMEYCDFLLELVQTSQVRGVPPFEDVHLLFGTLCALAELQMALPGVIRTQRPLHLVLDRRPFI